MQTFMRIVVLLMLAIFAWVIFGGPKGKPAGKPRKLTPAEQQDSIDRKKPIAKG